MTITLDPLPPREAIAALARRGARLEESFAWQDVWQETHGEMFTVAKSAGFDILSDIYAALQKALAEGKTFRDFAEELTPVLQAKGWWGRKATFDPLTGEPVMAQLGSVRRLQTIFDTNMRVSYAAGHWASFERNKASRPFLRYVAILDERTRPAHAARHNLVLPIDHPYWNTWAPPCGWNCRCTLQSLSQRDVDRMVAEGVPLKFEPPEDTFRDYVNRRTGEVSRVPDGIDPGWAYNPGKTGHAPALAQAEAKMARGLFGELPRMWPPPPGTQAELDKLATRLSEAQADWEDTLTPHEVEAIAYYKGTGARPMNAMLRGDEATLEEYEEEDLDIARALADDLDEAIGRATLPANVRTWRGVPDSVAEGFRGLKPGDTLRDDGFFSSSLNQRVAESFGDFVIEVRVPEGAPAIAFVHFIPDVNHVEYEVLVAPGVEMTVVEVRPEGLVVEVKRK
ncbi:phage minor head protein [Mesorhizobium sp. J428]|uniref:phage minor head protein n=1 Tax=Mesorhizobium sp. J428 TaxID=2898440 RepID=UPI002150E91C|nr:phage minor head protein [Mesorhizobium sp. J428]MCR5855986.1 minor capsid protein [Mesorhizobium sp. J428]